MNTTQNLSYYFKILRRMKKLDKESQEYVLDNYDYIKCHEDTSLQSKTTMSIVKQLINMCNENQQRIFWDTINSQQVRDIIFVKIKQVLDKYNLLLQDYYDSLDFKDKKYRGYMGW